MAPVTYAAAETSLAARLSPGAFAHSLGVAQSAAELAQRFGVDEELARIGGLLHDWDRELSPAELVSSAVAAGLEVNPGDSAEHGVLHAWTGASALREAFPDLADEVISAVRNHTVGSVGMSDLDKVVYVADMIEPGREYEGVGDLRRLATTGTLDELFAAAYQLSLAHLVRSRRCIHPQTVVVWNALVAGDRR